ncbi:MAG: hypothetical protein CL489_10025 [Acidobacteria bacterium]|nr:hypothetical protein [Acidobacteriota bacterium]
MPHWTPRVGQIETTMMEATAFQTANLVNAANRLPASTVETLLKLYGINRSNGVKATATVTITFTDTAGYTIPANTAMAYYGSDGSVFVYTLDDAAIVASGSASLTSVAVTAQAVGIGFNTPSNGSSLQLLATVPYVSSTVLSSKPSGGLDMETDTEYFTRATTTLAGYSSVMVTQDQLKSYVLTNYTGTVYRAKAYNMRRFSDRNMVTGGGSYAGYVLLVVAGENVNGYSRSIEDATISAADIATISTAITAKTATGVTVEVHNAELVGIGVTAVVAKTASAASGTVMTAVQSGLQAYLDSDYWVLNTENDRVVRVNEIVSLLDGIAGVEYVTSVVLTLPEESVSCATTANLSAAYDNGTLGVGATLTNSGSQAAFAVDGVTPSVEDRVLVKDQTAALQNGIYTVTVAGDGSTNWVLTRALDADTTNEMVVDRFVWCSAGSTNINKGFSCGAAGTIGTGDISFTQTSSAVRAEVLGSNATDGTGALSGDIRMNHLGMLTYPSTLTITVN